MCFYLFFHFLASLGFFVQQRVQCIPLSNLKDAWTFYEGHLSLVGRIFLPLASLLAPQIVSLVSNGHHEGYQKTLRRLSRDFFWVGLMKHVLDFVAACPTCQRNKVKTFRLPVHYNCCPFLTTLVGYLLGFPGGSSPLPWQECVTCGG